ncbi:TIGR00266 family protein [Anatilimnocola sp. NA78]|uniref:TIGR00266 family protein n=1 Tax=Anatilimnocola sp. NA78 TaxID=3415683 RepID=UPI003CE4F906
MSNIACTSCGKQYPYSPELAGRQVRCRSCGNVFSVPTLAPEGLEVFDAVPVAGGFGGSPYTANRGGRKSDEIEYEIFGNEMQFCEITLDPNEMVIAESGGMMYMSSGIKMETVFGDPSQSNQGFWGKMVSAGKRMMTGESLFMTTFTAASNRRETIAFAAPYPGKILPLHLDRLGGELICQKDSFLCGARGIQISIAFQKKVMVGLFGGEGFIMQKLIGDGIAMVHAGGTLYEKDLAPGETIKVDTGCIVALMPSVNYDIGFVGGMKNTLFGGEGLFLATLTGPGKIWLQSLPFSRLAGRVLANAGSRGSKDEGSVLGGLGNMVMGGGE